MGTPIFSEEQQEEIKRLKAVFDELELLVIEDLYRKSECDYAATMQALAEYARKMQSSPKPSSDVKTASPVRVMP